MLTVLTERIYYKACKTFFYSSYPLTEQPDAMWRPACSVYEGDVLTEIQAAADAVGGEPERFLICKAIDERMEWMGRK